MSAEYKIEKYYPGDGYLVVDSNGVAMSGRLDKEIDAINYLDTLVSQDDGLRGYVGESE